MAGAGITATFVTDNALVHALLIAKIVIKSSNLAFDARKKDDRGHPFFVAEKARFELALQFITVLTP